MLRAALVVVALLSGCKKAEPEASTPKPPAATLTTGTVASDGVRTMQITATNAGFMPDRIPAKPGEKLLLVFTRTEEGECIAQLMRPDRSIVELPLNKPVELPVTVPAEGEVKFACGMDMITGVVVAEKG